MQIYLVSLKVIESSNNNNYSTKFQEIRMVIIDQWVFGYRK